jgi:hypothetical protein
MGRRRISERPPDIPVDPNGTVMVAPEVNGHALDPLPPAPPPAGPKPNRPVAGFVANSDRTTRLEVAVWARQFKSNEGEEYTQYSLSLGRSWRDPDGKWLDSSSYRAHDVPVLLYLLGQAHDWCIAQRTTFRTKPDEELPF